MRACLDHVIQDFASRFGEVRQGRCVVLALGKLGSREMTAASDLDLILIYDFDAAHPESDAPQPLHATRYYTRLSQRLISALTVATRRGRLYDVDMRLRPSGRQGPLAIAVREFCRISGQRGGDLGAYGLDARPRDRRRRFAAAEVEAVASRGPCGAASLPSLRSDVAAMRALIAKEKGEDDPFDLKYAAGGLIDIDFLGTISLPAPRA